jgi:hypothetical protein
VLEGLARSILEGKKSGIHELKAVASALVADLAGGDIIISRPKSGQASTSSKVVVLK